MRLHFHYDMDEVRRMPWWKVAMYLTGLAELGEEAAEEYGDYGVGAPDEPFGPDEVQRPADALSDFEHRGSQRVEASADALRGLGFNYQTF